MAEFMIPSVSQIQRIEDAIKSIQGPGVTYSPVTGIQVRRPPTPPAQGQRPAETITFTLTGAATMGGVYLASSLSGTSSVNATNGGNLIMPMGMVNSGTNDLVAYNLGEDGLAGGWQSPTNGAYYQGRIVDYTGETPPRPIVEFYDSPLKSVLVQITGPAAGKGKYSGILRMPLGTDINATDDLVPNTLGAGGETCIVLNLPEVSQSTHDLDAPSADQVFFVGHVLQRNSDGTPVVVINGFQTSDCS